MRVNPLSAAVPVLLAMVVALALGCGPGIHYQAPAYDNQNGLTIHVQSIDVEDDQLKLRLTFQNNTNKVMMINRDLLTIKLPDGSVRTRDRGMYGLFGNVGSETTHMLPPNGGVHDVFLDFPMAKPADTAALLLTGITLDGQMAQFPDYILVMQAKK